MASHFKTTGIEISGDHCTAKAWAHFNATGTPQIQDDFGFSGIADVSTGYTNLTFDNDPGTYNYAIGYSQGASAIYCPVINEDSNDGTGIVNVGTRRWDNNATGDAGHQRIVVFTPTGAA